jgi:hypothetical protein
MAKEKEKKVETRSLLDFNEEDLLSRKAPVSDEEEEEEEVVDPEEEEEEEDTKIVPKRKVVKASGKGKNSDIAPPKSKNKAQAEPEEEEEVEEEEEDLESEEEEENEDSEQEKTSLDEAAAFYSKVSSITGNDVEVDYGDVDPISPEGVAIRERALVDKTIEDFVERIKNNYPQVYEALEYAHNGGDVEDLFRGQKDYSKVQIQEDDEDHAKQILTEYYQAKGITSDARIKRMIMADAESEDGLVKTAQGVLKEMADAQAQERAEELATQQREAQAQHARDKKFLESMQQVISTRSLGNFSIPSSRDAAEFFSYVKQHLQRDGQGGYLIITQVDPSQIEQQLQAEYFKYKNGNLEGLIKRKAATAQAQRLRLNVQKSEKKRTSPEDTKPRFKSIKDFET